MLNMGARMNPDLDDFSDSMNLAHRLKHTCIRDEKLIIDWIPEEMKDADRSKPDYHGYQRMK